MQNKVWYAGKCTGKQERRKAIPVAVMFQLKDGEWVRVENWEALYKTEPVVELLSPQARSLKPDEWVVFQLSGQGKNKVWYVQDYRRLYRYVDLSHIGGLEELHRFLLQGTKLEHFAGGLAVRTAPAQIAIVEIKQSNGLAQLGNSTVREYAFDPETVLAMPDPAGPVELYDLGNASVVRVHDWSSDEVFAARIIKAMSDATNPMIGDLIHWLEDRANKKEALLSLDTRDLTSANEALRSGELAKRLAADQKLLLALTDALLSDERVATLLSNEVERIAEKERSRARAKAEADVQREVESQRRRALSNLQTEIDREAKARRAASDAQHADRLRELDVALAAKRSAGEEQIRKALEIRETSLLSEVQDLEGRAGLVEAKLVALREEFELARGRLEQVADEEKSSRHVLASIQAECVTAETALAKLKAERSALSQKCPVPLAFSAPGTLWTVAEAARGIAESPLLTAAGKELMKQFLALCLAGEVPLLFGEEVNDFLLVAEMLVANGSSARMEGDPTVITFEDLWVRPGTEMATTLGQALGAAAGQGSAPRTALAVVERADRSGARFWYHDLSLRSQRGALPRRLLLCATLSDAESDEARELLSQAPSLVVRGAIAPASAVAIVERFSAGAFAELEPGDRAVDLKPFMPEVLGAAAGKGWGAFRLLRTLRVVAEAKGLGLSNTAALLPLLAGEPRESDAKNMNQPRRVRNA